MNKNLPVTVIKKSNIKFADNTPQINITPLKFSENKQKIADCMSGSGATLTATSSPDIKDFKIRKINSRGYSAKPVTQNLGSKIKTKACKTKSRSSSQHSSNVSSKSSNKSKKTKNKLIKQIWNLACYTSNVKP